MRHGRGGSPSQAGRALSRAHPDVTLILTLSLQDCGDAFCCSGPAARSLITAALWAQMPLRTPPLSAKTPPPRQCAPENIPVNDNGRSGPTRALNADPSVAVPSSRRKGVGNAVNSNCLFGSLQTGALERFTKSPVETIFPGYRFQIYFTVLNNIF